MIRNSVKSLLSIARKNLFPTNVASYSRYPISEPHDDEFDCKYENYLNRTDIDGWEVRRAMTELHGMDLVPSPPVIIAALRACRRVNDYALAIRWLESVKFKCAGHEKKIWPYIIQEISPTLEELGIETPERLGIHKPEMAITNVDQIH